MTFMYIFAVAGTVMFASYSKSERTDLKYKQSFRYEVQMILTEYKKGGLHFFISRKPVNTIFC